MTITLGWKSGVAAAFLVLCLVLWGVIAVKRAEKIDLIEAQRILELEETAMELEDAEQAAAEAHAEANEQREARRKTQGALDRAREALEHAKVRRLRPAEERDILREQNDLLETHLASALSETYKLRTEIVFLKEALVTSKHRFDIQGKRLEACHTRHKKQRRRNALSYVGVGAGALLVGFGLGSI